MNAFVNMWSAMATAVKTQAIVHVQLPLHLKCICGLFCSIAEVARCHESFSAMCCSTEGTHNQSSHATPLPVGFPQPHHTLVQKLHPLTLVWPQLLGNKRVHHHWCDMACALGSCLRPLLCIEDDCSRSVRVMLPSCFGSLPCSC